SAPRRVEAILPARSERTAGVVSEGLKLCADRATWARSGEGAAPNGIIHGIRRGGLAIEPTLTTPAAGGPSSNPPIRRARILTGNAPPGCRRSRAGTAVMTRPAPPP